MCNPCHDYMHVTGYPVQHRDSLHFLWGKHLQCRSLQWFNSDFVCICLSDLSLEGNWHKNDWSIFFCHKLSNLQNFLELTKTTILPNFSAFSYIISFVLISFLTQIWDFISQQSKYLCFYELWLFNGKKNVKIRIFSTTFSKVERT